MLSGLERAKEIANEYPPQNSEYIEHLSGAISASRAAFERENRIAPPTDYALPVMNEQRDTSFTPKDYVEPVGAEPVMPEIDFNYDVVVMYGFWVIILSPSLFLYFMEFEWSSSFHGALPIMSFISWVWLLSLKPSELLKFFTWFKKYAMYIKGKRAK